MSDDNYPLLFAARRSIRYHDRRRAYYQLLHQVTGSLTILLSGSVLFDLAHQGPAGETPAWMLLMAVTAAVLSSWDIVVGYSTMANLHKNLKTRFGDLEISIITSDGSVQANMKLECERVRIEQEEPPVYRALDILCHRELLIAEGFNDGDDDMKRVPKLNKLQRITRHLLHWADIPVPTVNDTVDSGASCNMQKEIAENSE